MTEGVLVVIVTPDQTERWLRLPGVPRAGERIVRQVPNRPVQQWRVVGVTWESTDSVAGCWLTTSTRVCVDVVVEAPD